MSRDAASIVDICDAVDRATSFAANLSERDFVADSKTRWAVYSQIVIIGEAARRVSKELQTAHGDVPWTQMIGMRHRLVHGYDEINWTRVWDTLVTDLPRLKTILSPLIPPTQNP